MTAGAGVAVAALLVAGCSQSSPPPAPDSSAPAPAPAASATAQEPSEVGTIARNLAVPWAMARLPDGSVLVTSRDTGVVNLVTDADRSATAGTVVDVVAGGEGGLLGIAVPAGADVTEVFVYYTAESDNRVARLSWDGTQLSDQEVILTGIPKEAIHDGGRIAFGPDGYLYVATGDAGRADLAQDPKSLAGKILRIDDRGRPAPDNPDPDSPVYSLGHRNVQGLAWDDDDRLWASEFGQDDVDELNLIVAGGNYGWPICEGPCDEPGMINPAATWSPTATASPSGMAITAGSAWIASLRGEVLYQVPLDGDKAGEPVAWFGKQFGRLRDVLAYSDGQLWVATNNTDGRGSPGPQDDRILQIDVGSGMTQP